LTADESDNQVSKCNALFFSMLLTAPHDGAAKLLIVQSKHRVSSDIVNVCSRKQEIVAADTELSFSLPSHFNQCHVLFTDVNTEPY
jgi:hypothetical protein